MQPTPNNSATIRKQLADAETALAEGPHADRARRDAETLLLHVIKEDAPDVNLAWLIARENEILPARETSAFRAWVERRRAGEPIQYITGEAEFYGLTFNVNRAVLIPRPETEHLVEKVIEIAGGIAKLRIAKPRIAKLRIADVGTGSGAIAVALASKLSPAWAGTQIHATDISAAALAVARENAERNGVADRVSFHEGDLLAPVAGKLFDFVVSNPPYVPERDRDSLSVEVRDYEPAQALFAGVDGLAIYRRLIPAAFAALTPGGFVALEIGFGQELAVGALLAASRFTQIEFALDLQGIPRVVVARRP
jgi:release factor glutamine methyltransferase